MPKYDCLRCGCEMAYLDTDRFQLGQHSLIFGDLPNLLAGSMELVIYRCPKCFKVEFYSPEKQSPATEEGMPQVTCPACGTVHDFDYPKCPRCEYDYYKR